MYTQCPDCGTVFKVTADALRAAQGTVRCGICSSGFNALEYLSEEPLLRPGDEPAHDDTITVEELPGTEFIELFTPPEPGGGHAVPRAGDEDSALPAAEADAAEDEAQRAAAIPDPASGADEIRDTELEFHGTLEDLERLFVELAATGTTPPGADVDALGQAIGEVASADLSGIEVVEESMPESAGDEADAHPGRIAAVLAFRQPDRGIPEGASPRDRVPVTVTIDDDEYEDPLSRTDEFPVLVPAAADDVGPGQDEEPLQILIPEQLRREAEAAMPEADAFAAVDERPEPGRRWPLAAAAALLLLALGAQAAHHWRDTLVRHPLAGPWLLRAYGLAGLRLDPPVDLSAFTLHERGAANDPGQPGRLKVRASIVNHAPFSQPYPLLRLSLQDRFGSTVGVRDLQPAEYLPGGGGGGLLAPSRRADAEIVLVDPGRDAVGYELDVCLRDAVGVRCKAELAGRRP